MPASINDLVGFAKTSSDLESRPMRIRYNEAQQVNSGQYFRMTFPRVADDMLDLRSIRLRFNVNLNDEILDEYQSLDSRDVRSIISRIRVLSGSQVLQDISEASLLFEVLSNIETSTNESQYDRYLGGREDFVTRRQYDNTREYITPIAPKGSLLNSDALLPLSRLSDLHVEFWLETPERVMYLPSDSPGQPNFNISNIEILCDYIRSASISQYYQSNPLSFHVVDYSHRYNILLSQQALCRFSSAHSSLNKILTIMRRQSNTVGTSILGKLHDTYSGENMHSYNVHVNNQLFYEEAIDSLEQSYSHFKKSFPKLCTSEWFDREYNTTKHLLCVDLAAAPPSFRKELSSGKKTSALNSDIVMKVDFTGVPDSAIRADSFLMSDVLIYLDGPKGDLKIKY